MKGQPICRIGVAHWVGFNSSGLGRISYALLGCGGVEFGKEAISTRLVVDWAGEENGYSFLG